MMVIDISELELPDGWCDRAGRALQKIKQLPEGDRTDAIKAMADIWSGLKPQLMKLSYDKCWYCETKQERSDNAVDHFRPKGRVAECNGHSGYWWLAFDHTNFRYCCTFCNSRRVDQDGGTDGGKQDHFPMVEGTTWASCATDDLDSEQPLLLDPTKAFDPGLLWFEETGRPVPKYGREINVVFCERAETSIRLYHLDHRHLIENRKLLFNYVAGRVRDGAKYFKQYGKGDTTAKVALDGVVTDLIKACDRRSEYSAAAKAYLMGFRGQDQEWLDAVIASI